ncbi:M81 family metallopeptidase [Rhizobium sp. A37_96]
MRIFIAGMDTETNTFVPIPTGYRSFDDVGIAHGDATSRPLNEPSCQLYVWRQKGEADGHTIIESLCVNAEPGGTTVRKVYEDFRDEILADLRNALPVDGVMFALHGAFVAQGYDDTEGDLLSRVRAIVGEGVPIAVELDLHCHLTDDMLYNADLIKAYKEYPHTDIMEVAGELYDLFVATARKEIRPRLGVFDCRMIATFRVQEEPMRGFVDRMKAMEGKDGILAVSLCHGFPHGDVADVGAKMLVVTDGDADRATGIAKDLGLEFFSMRDQLGRGALTIDQALDAALAETDGPIVIADTSDNAGGGAPGDSTFILRRILERGIKDVVSAMYWDPIAFRFCAEAGVGAEIKLRVGGKCGPFSGDPIDLDVVVKAIGFGLTQTYGGMPCTLGDAAWVSADGVDLIINTQRTQVFHPEFMVALGLDPADRKIVVVKSNYHFQAGFAPIAGRILFCAPPGATQPNYEKIPFTRLRKPYWPQVDNPFLIDEYSGSARNNALPEM